MTLIGDLSEQSGTTGRQPRDHDRSLPVSLGESLTGVVAELRRQRLAVRIAPGVWALRGDVQALLEEDLEPERFGHRGTIGLRCDMCGERAMTSVVGDRRMCEPCRSGAGPDPRTGVPPAA